MSVLTSVVSHVQGYGSREAVPIGSLVKMEQCKLTLSGRECFVSVNLLW